MIFVLKASPTHWHPYVSTMAGEATANTHLCPAYFKMFAMMVAKQETQYAYTLNLTTFIHTGNGIAH